MRQFDINITLTTQCEPFIQTRRQDFDMLNEQVLTDTAFLPKTFRIRLEHGRFDVPHLTLEKIRLPFFFRPPKYALRLLFNKSPIPPAVEWHEAKQDFARHFKFWECKEFVARGVPKDSWLVTFTRKVSRPRKV